MRWRFQLIAGVLAVALLSASPLIAKDSPDEKRQKVRSMSSQALADLYKAHPDARAAIQKSAGYGVFSALGVNLLLLSTAHGSGEVVNSATKQETFMKMYSAGVGLGAGVKNSRIIFVFETPQALTQFTESGWEASGQADAAAKAGKSGGAYSGATMVAPGVWVYQITKSGLALQATIQGTKYAKDDELNKK